MNLKTRRSRLENGFSPAWWFLLLLVFICAWFLRWPNLDTRPMHGDEAVHALKLRDVLQGEYRYDPQEYHGPTLYYLTLPILKILGASDIAQIDEAALRLVPLLAGISLIAFLPVIGNGLPRIAVLVSAALTAVSPAMVFYSRYYIQEMLLVAASFFLFAFLWRAAQTRKQMWLVLAGIALGFLHATKETDVLTLFAILFGAAATIFWTQTIDKRRIDWKSFFKWKNVWPLLAATLFVAFALLSNFFTYWRGPLDSLLTYGKYFNRAGDTTHVQPWHFYLSTLLYFKSAPGPWWSEALILFLALAGSIFALKQSKENQTLPRFLVFYTFALIAIYSLIPYKTPWCLLGFLHGMILLAGFGAASLLRILPDAWRVVFGLLLALGISHLAMQAQAATGRFETDRRNPYVYAHSSTDVAELGKQIDELAKFHPDKYQMRIHLIARDVWPLPWYLRRFDEKNLGYWNDLSDEKLQQNLDAPVVVTILSMQNQVRKLLRKKYHEEVRSQRPQVFLAVFVEESLWNKFLKSNEKP